VVVRIHCIIAVGEERFRGRFIGSRVARSTAWTVFEEMAFGEITEFMIMAAV